jgi:Lipase (class 3)
MSWFSGKKAVSPTPTATATATATATTTAAQTVPLVLAQKATGLRDTSLRSVVFGKKEFAMTPYSGEQVTLVDQVDKYQFDAYLCVLLKMAQLARLCYCDAGIIRAALISPEFLSAGQLENKPLNDLITRLDAQYKKDRYAPSTAPNSIEGRPPQSYIGVYGSSGTNTVPFARYISSPSDVTFMFVAGSKVKCPLFKPDDVILVFKGSSTMKNYKHDLYAQAKGYTELSAAFPEIPANPNRVNAMPRGFVAPLQKNFHLIKQGIADFKPRRLFITGQSLGGAYATICAFVLSQMKPVGVESIHLVSFGSPTVFGDGARNTFNEALDSGYMTLDRVVSHYGKYLDPISHVPLGFSHPGYQPLKTELYPELKTGRAYHLGTVKKVFMKQQGGLLGIGKEKGAYELATKTHIPNRFMVPVYTALWRGFPHGEYMDMTYAGVQRLPGLKNPGFKNHTFIAEFSDAGLTFKYVDAKPGDVPVADAQPGDPSFASMAAPAPENAAAAAERMGGTRKQRRKTRKVNRKNRRQVR